MLLLHNLLPEGAPLWLSTLLDAGLLTLTCFPFLWLFFLRPLQRAVSLESRKAQAIMETVADGIITTDDQYIIQTFNCAAGKIFGYSSDEAIGRPIQMLFAPGEPVAECLQHGEAHAIELQGRHRNGSLPPLEVSASNFAIEGAQQFSVVIRDVSERSAALAALQESEERYRMLFDNSNDAMFVYALTPAGIPTSFIDVNEVACKRLGYPRDELLMLSPLAINAPSDEGAMLPLIQQLRMQRSAVFERTHLTRDGQKIPVEINTRLFELHGQQLALSIARDISERKRTENLLRQANEQMEAIFSNTHILTAYLDEHFNFIRVNQAYAKADNREPDFFPGKNHFSLYPNAENEVIFRRVLDTAQPYEEYAKPFEYPAHPEWGVTYWDWTLTPIKDEQAKVTRLLLTLVNVTPRKLAELAREESERNTQALLNATTESIVLLDTQGVVLAANQTAARRFGLTPEQITGQNIYTFMSPEVAERRKLRLQEAILTGKPNIHEDAHDGRHFESSIHPILDSWNKVVRLAIYSTDITERRLLQEIDALMLEVNQQMLRGAKLQEILDYICTEAVRLFDFELAWVGRKETDGSVSMISRGGNASSCLDEIQHVGVRYDDSPQGLGPTGAAIKTGQTQIFRSSDPRFAAWMEAARSHGLEAIISLPLILRGEIFGAFSLYSHQPDAFNAPEVLQRLTAITSRISVALEIAQDHEKLRLLAAALETASNAVFITNRSGHIQWLNDAFTRMSGYSRAEAIGQTPKLLNSGKHDTAYYQMLWSTILAGEPWVSETIERHKDGHLYTVQQAITPIHDDSGQISHFISIHEDITTKKITEERIRHLAQYDALTSLPNRALFFEHLQQACSLAKRKQHLLGLLFLDLDGFKAINDTLGHHAGDLLLKGVAKRLRKCVRTSDIVARLGGDEFTVILPEITGKTEAVVVAEKIIAALGKPFRLEGHDANIGASIGIALYHSDDLEPDNLLKLADSAMYEAKKQGKNTYRFTQD